MHWKTPTDCRLIGDWLESRMKITVPHFHVFAYISIFSSSAQDDGCTRHNDNQKCNNKHKKRLLPSILSHQQHPPGQGKFFLWVKSQNYLQYYSQCSDSSLGLIILFILKYCRSLWLTIKPFNLNHPCYFNLRISIDLKLCGYNNNPTYIFWTANTVNSFPDHTL